MKSKRRDYYDDKPPKKVGRLKQLNKRNRINRSFYPMSELKVLDEYLNNASYVGHCIS